MSMDVEKIPADIMADLDERGVSINRLERMDAIEAFHEYCNWHGLIGWGGRLASALDALRRAEKK